MVNWVLIFALFLSFFIPLFLASTSGLLSERVGVVNIAIEGMMIFGGLGYVVADIYTNLGEWTFLIGIVFGVLFAMCLGTIHAITCILYNGNQIISGTAINFFAQGFGLVLIYILKNQTIYYFKNEIYPIPFYNSSFDVTFYIFLVFVVLLFLFYYRTKIGLRWRVCGEKPKALHSAGISVRKYRWTFVLISAAFAGTAGVCYIGHNQVFQGTANGWGYLALAILVFGQWKPLGIFLGSVFFAFVLAMSNVLGATSAIENAVPSFVFAALPYLLTLGSLVIFSSTALAPKYLGKHFKLY